MQYTLASHAPWQGSLTAERQAFRDLQATHEIDVFFDLAAEEEEAEVIIFPHFQFLFLFA